jgi:hypothetical protein
MESFFTIPLDIKNSESVEQALELLNSAERVDGYYSTELDSKEEAIRRCRICTFPEVFIIHLKRFEYDLATFQRVEIRSRCTIPPKLDFGNVSYSLAGVCLHFGLPEIGHYTSIVKISEKWYLFNDQSVHQIDEIPDSIHTNGYLVIFKQKSEIVAAAPPQEVRIEIDRENDIFIRGRNSMSFEMMDFINRHCSLSLNVQYFFRVFCHSKMANALIHGRIRTENAEDFSEFLLQNFAEVLDCFRNAASNRIVTSTVTALVRTAPVESSFKFALQMFGRLSIWVVSFLIEYIGLSRAHSMAAVKSGWISKVEQWLEEFGDFEKVNLAQFFILLAKLDSVDKSYCYSKLNKFGISKKNGPAFEQFVSIVCPRIVLEDVR